MITTMNKLPALALTLLLLAETGCDRHVPQAAALADSPAPQPRVETHSALGAYLAARIAQDNGDTKSAADFYQSAVEHGSDDADVLQNLLLDLLSEGRFTDAKPIADMLLNYDSEAPWPLVLLGVDAAMGGDFSAARQHFADMPRRAINGILAPLLSAWALEGNGLTEAALDALSPLAQSEGLKNLQALHAGLILDHAGRTEAALVQYKIALNGPLSIRSVEAAGSAMQRLGRMDEARDLYARYQAEHPDSTLYDAHVLLALGKTIPRLVPDAKSGMAAAFFDVAQFLRQNDSLPLSLIYNRLSLYLQPDFALAQLTAGDLLTAKGTGAEANAMYRSIAVSSSVHLTARLKLAENLDDQGDTAQALDELAQLQQERPNTVEIAMAIGDIQRHHKNYAEAAAAYSQAIDLYSGPVADTWSLHFSRGVCYERLHDWPKAEADFRWALSLKPDQPDVLNYLGYTWIDRGTNLLEARAMIEKAVRLRPGDGAIVDSLGWALFRLGDYTSAVAFLEKAVELKPVDSTINEHLGDAYWKAGRRDEARMQWRRAQGLDPEPEQIDGLNERTRTGQLPETASGPK